jgi:hypothetical protein
LSSEQLSARSVAGAIATVIIFRLQSPGFNRETEMLKASAGSSRSTAPSFSARPAGLLKPAYYLFGCAPPFIDSQLLANKDISQLVILASIPDFRQIFVDHQDSPQTLQRKIRCPIAHRRQCKTAVILKNI